MNLKRTLVLVLGSGAVGVWMATAATSTPSPVVAPPPPSPAAIAIDNSGAALVAEISRLHERLHPTAVPLHARDLLQYAPRRAAVRPSRATVDVPPVIEVPDPVIAAPLVKLIGIAEDGAADAIVRTAIVSGMNDLFLVKEGESFAGRYRVGSISSAGVELIDTTDESALNLTLP